MTGKRILVVYYSRTGRSRAVAEAVADRVGAMIEAIDDCGAYQGFGSYFRGIAASLRREATPVADPRHNPADFDMVVLIGPLWAGALSCPMRGYLARAASRVGRYAAFITATEGKPDRAFRQMTDMIGHPPAATGALTIRDTLGSQWTAKVDRFLADIAHVFDEPLSTA